MALLFVDGMQHYATNDIEKKWDVAYSVNINNENPRRPGGKHLRIVWPNAYVTKYFLSVKTGITLGFAIKVTHYGTDGDQLIKLVRLGDTQCSVSILADGSITVRRGDDIATLGTSAIGIVPLNAWFYLEFKVYIHAEYGLFDVRINETSVVSGSGVNTRGAVGMGADSVRILADAVVGITDICDLYIDDGPDFLGDCRIDCIWPNGVGDHTMWDAVPSGDNWGNAHDDSNIDDDATYNKTGIVNDIDTYEFEDIAEIAGTIIKAIVLDLCIRKDDAGMRKYKSVCRMTATDYLGDERDFWDSYKVHQTIWENPPNNPSNPWTKADVDAAEFGIKLTV